MTTTTSGTVRTIPIDMAYDEESVEQAVARISRDFDIQVTVTNLFGTAGGWPEVVLKGKPADVLRALEEAWGFDGNMNPDPRLMLNLDCPIPTCTGKVGALESDPAWAVCSECDLHVDLAALLDGLDDLADDSESEPEAEVTEITPVLAWFDGTVSAGMIQLRAYLDAVAYSYADEHPRLYLNVRGELLEVELRWTEREIDSSEWIHQQVGLFRRGAQNAEALLTLALRIDGRA